MLNVRRIVGLHVDVLRGIKPQYIRNNRVSHLSTKEAELPNEQPDPNLNQPQNQTEEQVSQAVKYVFLKPPPRLFSSSIKVVYTSAAGNPIQPAANANDIRDKAAELDKGTQPAKELDQSSSAAQQKSDEARYQGNQDTATN